MGRVLRAGALTAAVAAIAGAVAWLRAPSVRPRSAEGQGELERAVASVDRELAADLELMTVFDQTRRPFVLENGQFLAARGVLQRNAPEAYALASELYERIPSVETAMERRGPAGSIADGDRALIQAWEGDAREAQRAIRAALAAPTPSHGERLLARLLERFATRRPGG